jgi:hypothetical protein
MNNFLTNTKGSIMTSRIAFLALILLLPLATGCLKRSQEEAPYGHDTVVEEVQTPQQERVSGPTPENIDFDEDELK